MVFLLQKSGYRFLIGPSGEEWRGDEEDSLVPAQVRKKSISRLRS